jgi:hypothetical protein
VDLDVQLANGTSSRVRGLADLKVGAGLQWAPKKIGGGVFADRAVPDVDLPTGKYSDRRPANIGDHFVVVNPYDALTYERKKYSSTLDSTLSGIPRTTTHSWGLELETCSQGRLFTSTTRLPTNCEEREAWL